MRLFVSGYFLCFPSEKIDGHWHRMRPDDVSLSFVPGKGRTERKNTISPQLPSTHHQLWIEKAKLGSGSAWIKLWPRLMCLFPFVLFFLFPQHLKTHRHQADVRLSFSLGTQGHRTYSHSYIPRKPLSATVRVLWYFLSPKEKGTWTWCRPVANFLTATQTRESKERRRFARCVCVWES